MGVAVEMLILASIMVVGGLFAVDGIFDDNRHTDPDPPVDDTDVHGTTGNDTLTDDHRVIWGEDGDDLLTVSGTAVAHGGTGNDNISASDTCDAIGGSGNDTLTGCDGAQLFSGSGDDVVSAEDYVHAHGGAGNDQMVSHGHATLYGEDGEDRLTIGGEFSVGFGGAGNDTLTNNAHFDQLFGGDGNDYAQTSDGYRVSGDAGDDTLSGVSQLYGGEGDDSITGASSLGGGNGNDVIAAHGTGNAGYALAYGDAGDDTVIGHDSFESTSDFYGDDGNDLLQVYGLTSHSYGGAGDDTVISQAGSHSRDDAFVSLGSGQDLLAVEADGTGGPDILPVTDFNPAEDQLALILPPEDAANLTIVVTPDPGGSFTEIHLSKANDASFDITIHLSGISDFDPADLTFFANQAAVTAGTPYTPALA